MPRSVSLSFRAKLLLALVGLVGVLLGVTLVVVRAQTRTAVREAVRDAVADSRAAFARQEQDRQQQLANYAGRFAGSNRLPAALDEAVSAGASDFLHETIRYELGLAGIPRALAAFTDAFGAPVAAALNDTLLADPAAAVPAPLVERLLAEARPEASGYHLVRERLYSVRAFPLVLFGNPIGTQTLGSPVDDAAAAELARNVAAGAEVCFVAAGRCVASTPAARRGPLNARMVAMAGASAPGRIAWGGRRYTVFAERVTTGEGMQDAWRVIAVPLDGVLAPFERIQRAAALTGLLALALAVGVGLVLSRSLARPVRALVAATERVAAGDYDVRVPVAARDELGTLGAAFNEMAHGLALKEQYRGVLDKVVSRDIAEELLKGEITLGGETRQVATLFADVRGFTALTEGMEPQRVVAILNEIMEHASEVVEDEGGVVDKYVGDEVMAVFGAPVSRGGDVERAVRAALRIRDAVEALNAGRVARGEPPVRMGVGVNAGPAVAGNMGSPGRLNYTVLGESVNLASRLCAQAEPGEVLVSAAVYRAVRDRVEARPLGARSFKGLSAPLEVYAVDRLRADAPASPSSSTPPAAASAATAALAALALFAAPAAAQNLPTLEELGVGWTSPGGFWQVTPSGRLELEGFVPQEAPAWLIPETDPFLAGRLSLFVDVFAGKHLYGLVELRADRGEAPRDDGIEGRIEQAFVRLIPWAERDLSLQAGKFVSPFGGWPQRHHTAADPFIRPPLPYDYRTMICAPKVPGAAAGFLGWKDQPEMFRPIGAPVVWAAPYQVGAMLAGGWKGVSARVAVMNSAPSSEPGEWNDLFAAEHGPSLVAHLGWQVVPELRLGVSYDVGSYLQDDAEGPFPAGRGVDDYVQEIWGFEAAFTRGRVEARGELLLDRWEVPNVGDDPRDVSYYLETKVKLTAGLFAAARYGAIRFNEIAGAAGGGRERWDYDVERLQLGAGYRLSRTTELRAEYMMNRTDAPPDTGDDLFAMRWSWAF